MGMTRPTCPRVCTKRTLGIVLWVRAFSIMYSWFMAEVRVKGKGERADGIGAGFGRRRVCSLWPCDVVHQVLGTLSAPFLRGLIWGETVANALRRACEGSAGRASREEARAGHTGQDVGGQHRRLWPRCIGMLMLFRHTHRDLFGSENRRMKKLRVGLHCTSLQTRL